MTTTRIKLGDDTFEFAGSLMLPEAIAVERETGLTPGEFQERLQKGSAIALGALVWILKRRSSTGVGPFDSFTFDMAELDVQMIGDDGLPLDMERVAERAEELVADGMERPAAIKKAQEEEAARHTPRHTPTQEPAVDPQAAGTTGEPAPAPTPSSAPSAPTPLASATTSTSAPGSSPS